MKGGEEVLITEALRLCESLEVGVEVVEASNLSSDGAVPRPGPGPGGSLEVATVCTVDLHQPSPEADSLRYSTFSYRWWRFVLMC